MWKIDNISYLSENGLVAYNINIVNQDTQEGILVKLPFIRLTRSIVINSLIRSRYSQDHVEAIINNHFLNIAEWLDKKFAGSEESFDDPDYDELQNWRKECKTLADEIIDMVNKISA